MVQKVLLSYAELVSREFQSCCSDEKTVSKGKFSNQTTYPSPKRKVKSYHNIDSNPNPRREGCVSSLREPEMIHLDSNFNKREC